MSARSHAGRAAYHTVGTRAVDRDEHLIRVSGVRDGDDGGATLAGVGLAGARTIVAVMLIAIATDFGDIATGRVGAAGLRHNPRPREPDLAHDR